MKLDMVGIIVNDMTQALSFTKHQVLTCWEKLRLITQNYKTMASGFFKFTTNDYWCLWVCASQQGDKIELAFLL